MKNILILGGSYFLGRVFVEELLRKSDYSIYVVNRGNLPLNMDGVQEIVCNRHDIDLLKQSIPSLDWHAVVDFCAYSPEDIESMISIFPEGSVKHYIFISTTSIYDKSYDLPITEDAPRLTGPQKELGPQAADYAYNKWLAEGELEKQCGNNNIKYTIFRPAFIYGKYNYAPRESYFFDLITQNQTIVLPDNKLALFTFVSVWDVARIIIACMGNEKVYNKAFNLSGDELISYRRLVEVFEEVTEKRAITRVMSIQAIDNQRIPLPFPLDEHLVYSGSLITDSLDCQYTPFIEGMRETFKVYIENNGLALF